MQYILSTQPAKVAGICNAHNAERFTHPERSPCKSGMRKSVLFLARGVGGGAEAESGDGVHAAMT